MTLLYKIVGVLILLVVLDPTKPSYFLTFPHIINLISGFAVAALYIGTRQVNKYTSNSIAAIAIFYLVSAGIGVVSFLIYGDGQPSNLYFTVMQSFEYLSYIFWVGVLVVAIIGFLKKSTVETPPKI